jgi:uncharacterized RDD family membrane protein YckC
MKSQPRFAGFWIRLVADLIDSLLLDFAICLIGLMVLGGVYWTRPRGEGGLFGNLDPFLLQLGLIAARTLLSLIYHIWAVYRFETTLGKRVFRIYVVSARDFSRVTLKQAIIRCLSYVISYLPFGAGFLMVMFQPQKRALHDLIAGTVCEIRTLE